MPNTENGWIHPWNLPVEAFDDLDRDTRFFSLVIRGLLNWLDTNVKLYGNGIRHFIVQTGTEYLYQESNGYSFSWTETSGEDFIYMKKPRCAVEWESVEVMTEELSSPYARGTYERYVDAKDELTGNSLEIRAFNAEIKTLPLKLPVKLRYVLSRFNEQIILVEELLTLFAFTKYFSVSHLGDRFDCSVEFPTSITHAQAVKLDYSAERKDRIVELQLELKCQFPVVLEYSDVSASQVIKNYVFDPHFIKTRPKPDETRKPKWKYRDHYAWTDGSTGNMDNPLFKEPSDVIPGPEIPGAISTGTSVAPKPGEDEDGEDPGGGNTGGGNTGGGNTGGGNTGGGNTGGGNTGGGNIGGGNTGGDDGKTDPIRPSTEWDETPDRELVKETIDELNSKDQEALDDDDPNDSKNDTETALTEEFKDKVVQRLEEGLELRFSDHETEVIERILLDIDQMYINSTKSRH